MNSKIRHLNYASIIRRGAALLSIAMLLASTFAIGISAQSMKASTGKSAARLNENQRILHVLNRLGFGARPGDIERVKAIGLEDYINQQLNPEKIKDAIADARIKDLPTLSMTTAELYEKYPQPGQLLRQLQRRGELPSDLAEAQKNKAKDPGTTQSAKPQVSDGAMTPPNTVAKNENAARSEGNAKVDAGPPTP